MRSRAIRWCRAGRLDLRTGDVWPGETYDSAEFGDEEDREDDEQGRWLELEPLRSEDAYRDRERCTSTIEDDNLVERLEIALTG